MNKACLLVFLTLFFSLPSFAKEYCGYLNRVVVVEKAWDDVRLAIYNKDWPEKYITFQNSELVIEIAKIIVAKSKDYSNKRGAQYRNYFEWYYKTSQSSVELCVNGNIYRKRKYKNRTWYYVAGYSELLSIKIDGVTYDVEELKKELKMTSNENQLLCLEYYSMPNLLDPKQFKTCFYADKLCYTGDINFVVDAIEKDSGLIATGDEHSLDSVLIEEKSIHLKIFDRFSYGNQGGDVESRGDYIETYVVPHCATNN